MSIAFGIYRLQQTDIQIEQVENRLAQIRQTLENDAEAQQANSRLASAKENWHKAEQKLRQCEAETESQRLKIEQHEASLYGGSVHNPKELQDLQNEVAALKRYLVTLEDQQLQAMLECEEAEHEYASAKAAQEVVIARLSVQNKDLSNELALLERDLQRLYAERQAIVTALPENLLTQYENLRQARRGRALATVSDNSCDACGTTLTAAIQQAARSPVQIAFCPTCGRILYAG